MRIAENRMGIQATTLHSNNTLKIKELEPGILHIIFYILVTISYIYVYIYILYNLYYILGMFHMG